MEIKEEKGIKQPSIKTLIVVRGLPGAGKTTVAEFLSSLEDDHGWGIIPFPVISADHYFEDENGNYNWNPAKIGLAHDQCKSRTRDALKAGVERVFVANTFTQEKEIQPYKNMSKKYGYRFVSMIIENRHEGESIHGVPEKSMEKMKDRFSIKL